MDERDTFNSWCDQWEKAQKKGIFKDAPKTRPPTPNYEDFFGNYNQPKESQIEEPDAEYWQQVYQMSSHAGESPDIADPEDEQEEEIVGSGDEPAVLSDSTLDPYADYQDKEDTSTPARPKWNRKGLEDIHNAIAKSPNPIYPNTKGPDQGQGGERDQSTTVTKNWIDGSELVELHVMKINLEKLESKMNAAEGHGDRAKAKKIRGQIDELWKKIDQLSDSLDPDFVNDYLS
jgi:hypothetical protein